MFKWPQTFEGLLTWTGESYTLSFWKLFFSKLFYSERLYGIRRDKLTEGLYEERLVKSVGSKLAPTNDYGEAMLSEAREYVELEKLYSLYQRKVGYKPYADLDWGSIIQEVEEELEAWKAEDLSDSIRTEEGEEEIPHIVKSPYDWIRDNATAPARESLWGELWYEREIACLYGDSNIGKSVYAMQIATEVSEKRRVLYMDYEMDEQTFSSRYTDDKGREHKFPMNLYRAQINPSTPLRRTFQKDIFTHLEKLINSYLIDVVIIDNLTYITGGDSTGETASRIIYRLKQLKEKYGVSFLIVAHTKRRDRKSAIGPEDLMANRRFFHFIDSAFAINRSEGNDSSHYVKQIKCRNREISHGSDRVISYNLKKIGTFLCFEKKRVEKESELLPRREIGDMEWVRGMVRKMSEEKISYSEIAKQLGISKSKVFRILRKEDPNVAAEAAAQ